MSSSPWLHNAIRTFASSRLWLCPRSSPQLRAPSICFSSLWFLPAFAGLSWCWSLSTKVLRFPSSAGSSQLTIPSPLSPSRRGSGNSGCGAGREECSVLLTEGHCLLISKEAGDFNCLGQSWKGKLGTARRVHSGRFLSYRSRSRSLNTPPTTGSGDRIQRTGPGVSGSGFGSFVALKAIVGPNSLIFPSAGTKWLYDFGKCKVWWQLAWLYSASCMTLGNPGPLLRALLSHLCHVSGNHLQLQRPPVTAFSALPPKKLAHLLFGSITLQTFKGFSPLSVPRKLLQFFLWKEH